MTDLSLSPEQELLRNTARDFIERECPLSTVRRIVEDEEGFSRELWRKTAELGWHGLLVSQEYGGSGGSLTDAAVLFEELGRGCVPGPYVSTALAALLIQQSGSDEQRTAVLPGIASGERIVVPVLSNLDYDRWVLAAPVAVRVEERFFSLHGASRFVPDAGAASHIICFPRTTGRSDAQTLFLEEAAAAGVSVRRMSAFSGEVLYEITFADANPLATHVIGEVDNGWAALRPALEPATALLCAYMAGATHRVYEMSMAYAQQRVQFGQRVARFQRVQDRLIEMLNAADAARWTAYEAVWKLENEKPDAALAVSVAKVAASEGFYRACEDAHHVHAGIGSEKGYGLYLYTMKSRRLYHYLGDPAYHRKRIAELLGV